MTDTLQSYLEFMTETAYLAGRLTMGYFQMGLQPDYKNDKTPVTLADRLSEELIRTRIEKKYPGHAIVGEEFGEKDATNAAHRWIIDPIDGTKAFIRGVPLYAILIGLEIEGKVEAGAVYLPGLDEMLVGATGLGTWWNGRRAHVSEVPTLKESFISTTDFGAFAKYGRTEVWDKVAKSVYYRGGWSDSYGFVLVATGRLELMIEPKMAVWDCGPFPPILREAGGFFGDWNGVETIYGGEAIGTTQRLLPDVLKLTGNGK